MAAALKEQLTLITFVILFAGLIATETYYAAFGVRYQLLELSVTHLVYRGLTAALDSPALVLAYLVTIAWLSFGADRLAGMRRPWVRRSLQPITYALILVVVGTTYFAAVAAGARFANLDLQARTSRLPVVQEIKDSEGKPLPFAGYRMLMAGKDTIVVFRAVDGPAESPFIHLLKRETTGEITLLR
jgi:hypothetical protein